MLHITLTWHVQTIIFLPDFANKLQENNLKIIEEQVESNNLIIIKVNAYTDNEIKIVNSLAANLFKDFLLNTTKV